MQIVLSCYFYLFEKTACDEHNYAVQCTDVFRSLYFTVLLNFYVQFFHMLICSERTSKPQCTLKAKRSFGQIQPWLSLQSQPP